MPTIPPDIHAFSNLLGKKRTSKELKQLMGDFRGEVGDGQLTYYRFGFDILLMNERKNVHSLRFLSPLYSLSRGITPYAGTITDDLVFPLTRKQVRSKLGKPARSSDKFNLYDEYDYCDHCIRFCYPMSRPNDVVFVTLDPRVGDALQASGIGDPLSIDERLGQLTGSRRSKWLKRLEAYELAFGPAKRVYSSANVDIDVLVFRDDPDYLTLVTSGMSDRRMTLPRRSPDPHRVELEMYVKTVKPLHIEWLLKAAEFPFVEKTYVGHGDTINWNSPIAPGSKLDADLLTYSTLEAHRDLPLTIQRDSVQLLWCVPITAEELDYKKEHGIDALFAVFDKVKHPLVLNAKRKSHV